MSTVPPDIDATIDATIDAAITEGYARRDRANMQPTIDYFQRLLTEHPGHPTVLYEVGGAYDTAGEEQRAVEYYERALTVGLSADVLRRCLIQYGSTLRNLDRFDDSLRVLRRARTEFPESEAVRVFLALSLHAAHRFDEAMAELLELTAARAGTGDIARYTAAIVGNAEYLRERNV